MAPGSTPRVREVAREHARNDAEGEERGESGPQRDCDRDHDAFAGRERPAEKDGGHGLGAVAPVIAHARGAGKNPAMLGRRKAALSGRKDTNGTV
jgi:hypothetical protein